MYPWTHSIMVCGFSRSLPCILSHGKLPSHIYAYEPHLTASLSAALSAVSTQSNLPGHAHQSLLVCANSHHTSVVLPSYRLLS